MIGNANGHAVEPGIHTGPRRCTVCGLAQHLVPVVPTVGAKAMEYRWPHFVCRGYREFEAQSVDLGGPYEQHESVTLQLWPDGRVTWTE